MRPLQVWILFLLAFPIFAQERIIEFNDRIVVNDDATLTVTEIITVYSAGQNIKHGIFRDFPTDYTTRTNDRFTVGFEVLSVLRDGMEEPYVVDSWANGKRIRIGRKNILIDLGVHTYTIIYTTTRQIGFFENSDELYWNVTGNGWMFPIGRATATVQLPGEAGRHVLQIDGYTGAQGSRRKNFTFSRDAAGKIVFATTSPLAQHQGLTIAISFPKGYVQEPTAADLVSFYLADNAGLFIAGIGILILLIYYMIVWNKFGVDPEKGTIIPQFVPPASLSPSAMRYIMKMGYDNKAFASAILTMAVKGYLTISEAGSKYTLTRREKSTAVLRPSEQLISLSLFSSDSTIEMDQKNHEQFADAIKQLKISLKRDFEVRFFVTNQKYFIPGIVFSLILFGVTLFTNIQSPEALLIVIWLGIWTVGIAALLVRVISGWKIVIATGFRGMSTVSGTLFLTIFALPFIAGEFLGIYFLGSTASPAVGGIAGVLVFINYLFYRLLKAPTRMGRMAMDAIEGFKMYLSTAEKDRLNMMNPPERTPELFEKYLPYALALDVEQSWSEQFADVLSRAQQAGQSYSPYWYQGTNWNALGAAGFASSFGGSFTSAISSSSTAPGSSSGSGGGGSSGGGGGGGGGGGW